MGDTLMRYGDTNILIILKGHSIIIIIIIERPLTPKSMPHASKRRQTRKTQKLGPQQLTQKGKENLK